MLFLRIKGRRIIRRFFAKSSRKSERPPENTFRRLLIKFINAMFSLVAIPISDEQSDLRAESFYRRTVIHELIEGLHIGIRIFPNGLVSLRRLHIGAYRPHIPNVLLGIFIEQPAQNRDFGRAVNRAWGNISSTLRKYCFFVCRHQIFFASCANAANAALQSRPLTAYTACPATRRAFHLPI